MTAPRLSIQLYSVREALAADLDGALARVASLGFREVEAYDIVRRAPELAAALARHGLAATTAHAPLISGPTPVPTHDEVFDAAVELGAHVVFEPMAHRDRWSSAEEVRAMARELNAAARAAASRGLAVGYHNHSYEFHHVFDGVTAYELFVTELDPAVVLEVDVYWAQAGGQDVLALLGRLGDRVTAVHVKDGRTDVDAFRAGDFGAAALGQTPAGRGSVPVEAILSTAPALAHAVVEFDAYDGDVFEGIAATVEWLAQRGIR